MTAAEPWEVQPEPYDYEGDENYDRPRFKRFKLGEMAARGVPDPKLLCDGLLYEHGFHSIAGEPDSGKTTIAYWFAAQLVQEGHRVMIIDEEQGPRMAHQKLRALGVSPAEMDDQCWYVPYPRSEWKPPDDYALAEDVRQFKPTLAIFDSASSMMSMAKLDENKPGDAVGWFNTSLLPLTRSEVQPIAVLLIDHDAKATPGRAANGNDRYARGTGGKLAAIDVQFKVKLIQPFSRYMDGQVALTISKDREGYMHPRRYRMNVSRKLRIDFLSQAETLAADQDEIIENLNKTQAMIYQVMDGTPLRKQEIANRVTRRFKSNLNAATVGKAMAVLCDLGVTVVAVEGGGRGNEAAWVRAGSHQQAMVEPGR